MTLTELHSAAPAATDREVLDLANLLRPVLLQLNRRLRREVHSLGVTGGQVSLLSAIHATPGMGVNELAVHEGSTAPSICVHIDRLEAAGLVARTRAASGDRRRVGLNITAEGQRVLHAVRSRRTAWLATRIAQLSPAERALLAQAAVPLQLLIERP